MQTIVPKRSYQRKIRTYTFLTFIIFVGAAVYGYFQYREFAAARLALTQEQQQSTALSATVAQFKDDYLAMKATYDKDFESLRNAIDGVYPGDEMYTALTRAIEDFCKKNDSSSNPLFPSDLKFGQVRYEQNQEYGVLPLTLTLSTTRENFSKFLRFVENSGSLDDGTRLLDVTSISISFSGKQNTGPEALDLLSVSLAMNAYFQRPANVTEKAPATTSQS